MLLYSQSFWCRPLAIGLSVLLTLFPVCASAADLTVSADRTTQVDPAGEGVTAGDTITVNNGVTVDTTASTTEAVIINLPNLTLNNFGTITRDVDNNVHAINATNGADGGNFTVNNHGTILGISTSGAGFPNPDTMLTLNNFGSIISSDTAGQNAIDTNSGCIITNHGDIDGNTACSANNSAALSITNAADGTMQNITMGNGTGQMTIINAGTIDGSIQMLPGVGGTISFNNSGTINPAFGSNVLLSDSGLDFVNTGTIASDSILGTSSGALNITNSGTMAAALMTSTSTVTNTGSLGALTFLGGNDTLILGTGSNLTADASGGGTDTLVLTGNGSEDNNITGFGMLTVNSGAAWTLSGNIDATTSGTISGALTLSGTLTSANVTIASGGTLKGIGTVSGAVDVAGGGHIAPGNNGIGTLNLTDLTFASGGIYNAQLNNAGSSDLLNLTGQATLTGGTLALDITNGYQLGHTYTVLSAAGGITGTFTPDITLDHPFLSLTMGYTGTDVTATIADNGATIASLGSTPNEQAVGAALDAAAGSGGAFGTLADNYRLLTREEATSALQTLSGDAYTVPLNSAINAGNRFMSQMHTHASSTGRASVMAFNNSYSLADLSPSANPEAPWPAFGNVRLWVETAGDTGHTKDGNTGSFDMHGMHITTGIETDLSAHVTAGLAMGYSNSWSGNDSRHSDNHSRLWRGGVYGSYTDGPLSLSSSLSAGIGGSDTTRDVTVGMVTESPHGSPDIYTFGGSLRAAYAQPFEDLTLTPNVTLIYNRSYQESFDETNAPTTGLHVGAITDDSLRSIFDLEVKKDLALEEEGRVTLTAHAGWAHEYLSSASHYNAYFLASPTLTGFTASGVQPAADSAVFGLGVTTRRERFDLSLRYEGEVSSDSLQHAIIGRMTYHF